MITDLYRFVTENREKIVSNISLQQDSDATKRAKELWISYSPSPRSAEQTGIDSGWNYTPFHGFYFYAIDAVATNLAGETVGKRFEANIGTMEVRVRDRDRDTGMHNPGLFLESIGMEFEKELAEEVRDELVLLDGSLLARYYNRHKGVVENDLSGLVRNLLKRGNVVFIAKYSASGTLLNGPVGDMYYFHHLTTSAGFSAPKPINDLGLSFIYARLSDHSPVIRIEMPGNVNQEEVKRLLDMLAWKPINGYPYVLLEAHRQCKVTNDELKVLVGLLGLSYEEGAREVLWE